MKQTLIAVGAGLSVPVVFGGAMMIAATTYAAKPGTEPPPEPSEPIVLYCDGPGESYLYDPVTGELVDVFRPEVQWGFTLTFAPEGATLSGNADYAESDVPVPLTIEQLGPNKVYLEGYGGPGDLATGSTRYTMHIARQSLNFSLYVENYFGDDYRIEGTCSTQQPQI